MRSFIGTWTWSYLALAMVLAACEAMPPPRDRLTLAPARFADLAGWTMDRHGEALVALKRSCARLATRGDDAAIGPGGIAGTARDWRLPCSEAMTLADGDDATARVFFERNFTPLRAANNDRVDGLFTGYYEPELKGARQRGGRYTVPVYGRPAELVMVDLGQFRAELRGQRIAGRVADGNLVPYASRAEIEAGALRGRNLELVWVDEAVDAFFLEIQGSGRIVLEDGAVLQVSYTAQNGHPYVAIGRELIARGALARENVSMQSIRAWLADHPGEAQELMNRNPSFVFFRALDGDGPIGAEGTVLAAGRSLAVDRTLVPLGVPIWLDCADPLDANMRLRRLMVAQDTGGAIRGPVRGDVFWGHGAEAAERAGRMRSTGRYWLLLPRAVAEKKVAAR
ncbi:MAG: MltA domain-containing protein [Proteobacteria bacterium]|nr:MltA domain-containing protein [Pseudomonadota bacterium]